MALNISQIYTDFKQGRNPQDTIGYDDSGRLEYMASKSNRTDIVCIKHFTDNKYTAIRIEPKKESQNEMMRRNIAQPHKILDTNKEFQHCIYQLGIFDIPEFRLENTTVNRTMLHNACSWNSPNVTKLKIANSPQELERAWIEHNTI